MSLPRNPNWSGVPPADDDASEQAVASPPPSTPSPPRPAATRLATSRNPAAAAAANSRIAADALHNQIQRASSNRQSDDEDDDDDASDYEDDASDDESPRPPVSSSNRVAGIAAASSAAQPSVSVTVGDLSTGHSSYNSFKTARNHFDRMLLTDWFAQQVAALSRNRQYDSIKGKSYSTMDKAAVDYSILDIWGTCFPMVRVRRVCATASIRPRSSWTRTGPDCAPDADAVRRLSFAQPASPYNRAA